MNKIEFTQHQKYELCYLIGDWYIKWKDCLINVKNETHNLCIACDDLINIIENNKEKYELSDDQLKFISFNIGLWESLNVNNLVIDYKKKIHRFGYIKEMLKIMVCNDYFEVKEIIKESKDV